MFSNEYFIAGYSGDNVPYDMGLILTALISNNVKTYFEYVALLSKWNDMMIKNNFSQMLNEIRSTRYFLDPIKLKYFVTDQSKVELGKQYYKNIPNFEFLLSILWESVFPCHQKQVLDNYKRPKLKICKWKGIELPCESIFSKSITDKGICCSFNRDKADKIYVESTFTKIILELQQIDKLKTPTRGEVPNWYANKREPTLKTGDNMGLYIEVDSSTDYQGYFSISSDFLSPTILIGPSGKIFNLNKLGNRSAFRRSLIVHLEISC
jgi:hypothetical protein